MPTLASLLPTKVGDDFELNYALPLEFAAIVDTIESQIRQSDQTLIQTLTVTKVADTDTAGNWTLYASSADTSVWPVKTLYCDVKNIAVDGTVIHSDTFTVPVGKSITL